MAMLGVHTDDHFWLQALPYVFEPPVPPAAMLEASYEVRMRFASWAYAWYQHVSEIQRANNMPALAPCSWCGQPTGDWCESCPRGGDGKYGRAHSICMKCEATIRECRLCRLSRQIAAKDSIPPDVHVQPGSAWAGMTKCAACGEVSEGHKLCSGCHCFRFCSKKCHKALWRDHKSMCQWLQKQQPLLVIAASRMPLAEKIRKKCADHLVPPIRDFDVSASDGQPGAGSSED